ncbi:FliH/SctL family protein [Sansalvadorimonas sp. 2012CJ34-2]|uniref:Flagellar assembly protein FliH n=1 Tax=Parendozoicomonas callyspongiae TaxID=2942213 RepID=A0ABT0PE09_9GAMM|nr:FliH/SctL family protein [Sansalvadorimonas sp. 2012CJ34-2]MCL6269543.1 FliH/SctL family protein [Sansalvadorimonas sp. 2012CJ34-2]
MSRRYLLLKQYRFPRFYDDAGQVVDLTPVPSGIIHIHLRTIFWKAYRRGYKKGLKMGHEEGLEQGEEKGQKEGFRDGQNKGYQMGFSEGLQTGKSEAEHLLAVLNQLWRHLSSMEGENWETLGRYLVTLIRDTCQKVVMDELRTSAKSLEKLVQDTLSLMPRVDDLRIIVHPRDKLAVERLSDQFPEQWQIVTDSSITEGGCLIKAGSGDADARVETRLDSCLDEIETEVLQPTKRKKIPKAYIAPVEVPVDASVKRSLKDVTQPADS